VGVRMVRQKEKSAATTIAARHIAVVCLSVIPS